SVRAVALDLTNFLNPSNVRRHTFNSKHKGGVEIVDDNFEDINFKAKLCTKDLQLKNLNVKITIDNIRYGTVEGYIYGKENYEEIKKLVELSNKPPATYITIEGTDRRGYKILLSKVTFNILHKKQFIVAEFSTSELKIVKNPKYNNFKTYSITFTLNNVVPGFWLRDMQQSKIPSIDTGLGRLKYFSGKNRIKQSYDNIEGEFSFTRSFICFDGNFSDKTSSLDETYYKCCSLVKDFLLLISFNIGYKVEWIKLNARAKTEKDNFKAVQLYNHHEFSNKEITMRDCLVQDFKSFLKITHPKFKELKENDFPIEEGIIYYLASQKKTTIESHFIYLCTALETLKDGYSRINKLNKILTQGQFNKLKSKMKDLIRSFSSNKDINNEKMKNVIRKLPELNRPPFKKVLLEMIKNYNLNISDIYENNKEFFKFLKYRNVLIHSGEIKNEIDFQICAEKLQIVVERLLLRLLNWPTDKGSCADNPTNIDYLDSDYFYRKS
ncbi:MAG: hypothetical protein ACOCRX_11060, partial [Candidatus Woesearchaeota archaeon]